MSCKDCKNFSEWVFEKCVICSCKPSPTGHPETCSYFQRK